MKTRKHSILIVEDSEALSAVYSGYLEVDTGYQLTAVTNGADALANIFTNAPDVLLLDLNLPDMHGMDILRQVHEQQLPTQTIIITAHGSVDLAVDALHLGAFDFLVKPFDARRLRVTVRNALERREIKQEIAEYRDSYDRTEYEGFVGNSLIMQSVYRTIDSAATSNATIFITGESGTGKEVCANAVHQRSPRAKNAFIALNCGAIPKDLIESEIFGHVKGAFTGAVSARDGAARMADGGTLFLDEICEMDYELQSKLLRFIQTCTFNKVGSSSQEQVNVRFICATNRDPWQEVKNGNFREDLYYRLHVIPIQLPPLRDRDTDILLLMNRFLEQFSHEERRRFKSFSSEAKNVMLDYHWPGNIRQLQNVIRQIVVLNDAEQVSLEMISARVKDVVKINEHVSPKAVFDTVHISEAGQDIEPLWRVEKAAIERAIELCGGNVPKAAAMLEISASTVYRKKERW